MNGVMAAGLANIVFGLVYLWNIALRKGERFEYAMALFFTELGAYFIASQLLVDSTLKTIILILFAASAFGTGILWLWLLRQFKQRQKTTAGSVSEY